MSTVDSTTRDAVETLNGVIVGATSSNKPERAAPALTYHGIVAAQQLCHFLAKNAGWWTDLETGEPLDRNDGEMIALMHSELSEALEGVRKDTMDDHLPHRKSAEVELADLLIRVFDFAEGRGLDLAGAMMEKLAYNQARADHKIENRKASGGKKF